MKKRLISLTIALVMLIGLMPSITIPAGAGSSRTYADYLSTAEAPEFPVLPREILNVSGEDVFYDFAQQYANNAISGYNGANPPWTMSANPFFVLEDGGIIHENTTTHPDGPIDSYLVSILSRIPYQSAPNLLDTYRKPMPDNYYTKGGTGNGDLEFSPLTGARSFYNSSYLDEIGEWHSEPIYAAGREFGNDFNAGTYNNFFEYSLASHKYIPESNARIVFRDGANPSVLNTNYVHVETETDGVAEGHYLLIEFDEDLRLSRLPTTSGAYPDVPDITITCETVDRDTNRASGDLTGTAVLVDGAYVNPNFTGENTAFGSAYTENTIAYKLTGDALTANNTNIAITKLETANALTPLDMYAINSGTRALAPLVASETYYTNYPVTDYSGNPIEISHFTELVIDTRAPFVLSIDIGLSAEDAAKWPGSTSQAEDWPEDIERSLLYRSAEGERLQDTIYYIELSEPIVNESDEYKAATISGIYQGDATEYAATGLINNNTTLVFDIGQPTSGQVSQNEHYYPTTLKANGGLVDAEGNSVVNELTLYGSSDVRVTRDIFLDTTAPQITVTDLPDSLLAGAADTYTMTIEVDDGDESDSRNSGVKGTIGTLSATTDLDYDVEYQFAMSGTAALPADSAFVTTQASARQNLAFISNTVYAHIKGMSARRPLTPTYYITVADHAGNVATEVVGGPTTDYSVPTIAIGGTGYDNGNLFINYTIRNSDQYNNDVTGNYKYQWVEKGAAADDTAWTNTSYEILDNIYYDNITSELAMSPGGVIEKDFLIEVFDNSGNSTGVIRVPVSVDTTKVAPRYTINTDLSVPQNDPQIMVTAPTENDATSAWTLVLVEHGSEKYLSVLSYDASAEPRDIFGTVQSWRTVTSADYVINDEAGTIVGTVGDTVNSIKLNAEDMYGDVTVTIATVEENFYISEPSLSGLSIAKAEPITVRFNGNTATNTEDVYSVGDISILGADGTPYTAHTIPSPNASDSYESNNGGNFYYLVPDTLAGNVIRFNITDKMSTFGADDIDFENSYLELSTFVDSAGDYTDVAMDPKETTATQSVVKIPLNSGRLDQTIVVPSSFVNSSGDIETIDYTQGLFNVSIVIARRGDTEKLEVDLTRRDYLDADKTAYLLLDESEPKNFGLYSYNSTLNGPEIVVGDTSDTPIFEITLNLGELDAVYDGISISQSLDFGYENGVDDLYFMHKPSGEAVSANISSVNPGRVESIRVWNAGHAGPIESKWIDGRVGTQASTEYNQYWVFQADNIGLVTDLDDADVLEKVTGGEYLALMEGKNVVNIQAKLFGGELTSTKQMIINVVTDTPTISVTTTPNGAKDIDGTTYVAGADISLDYAISNNGSVDLFMYNGGTLIENPTYPYTVFEEPYNSNFKSEGQVTFVAVDDTGGFGVYSVDLTSYQFASVDSLSIGTTINPESGVMNTEQTLYVTHGLSINTGISGSNRHLIESATLAIMEVSGSNDSLTYTPIGEEITLFSAGELLGDGLEAFPVTNGVYAKEGASFLYTGAYDETLAADAYTPITAIVSIKTKMGEVVTHQTTLDSTDTSWGGVNLPPALSNTKPVFESSSQAQSQYGATLTFNAPVKLVSPMKFKDTYAYAERHYNVPIYENGNTKLVYEDAYGNEYTENVTIDGIDYTNIIIELADGSTLEETENPVTLNITAQESITAISGEHITPDLTPGEATASVTATANTTITIEYTYNNGTSRDASVNIVISNITGGEVEDTTAPVVNVGFTPQNEQGGYTDTPVEKTSYEVASYIPTLTQSTGYKLDFAVTDDSATRIILKSAQDSTVDYASLSESIAGVSVSGDTVTVSDAVSFFVYVVDEQGNKIEIPFDMTSTIDDSTVPPVDTTDPVVSVAFSKMTSGAYTALETKGSAEVAAYVATLDKAEGFRLLLTNTDASAVKTVIKSQVTSNMTYATATSDDISGVTINGTSVEVSAAASFHVYVIDAADNVTTFAVDLSDKILSSDDVAIKDPVVVWEDVRDDGGNLTGKTVYITPQADSPFTCDNAEKDDQGRYYHTFTADVSFIFSLRNEHGTTRNYEVTAWGISPFSVLHERWSNNNVDDITNTPVTVTLTTNRFLTGASITGGSSTATISYAGSAAMVTFSDASSVTISLEVGSDTIPMTLAPTAAIDTTPAGIFVDDAHAEHGVSDDLSEYTIYFKSDEPVRFMEGDSRVTDYLTGGMYTTVDRNGEHEFTFVDEAGNITKHSLTITDIANEELTPMFSLSSSGADSVSDPSDFADLTAGNSVYVMVNKDNTTVTNMLDETDTDTLTKDTWTLLFEVQSSYDAYPTYHFESTTTVDAKSKTWHEYAVFTEVSIADNIAPVITLKNRYISVTGASGVEAALRGNIASVSDNIDSLIVDDVAFTSPTVTGTHELMYTITDNSSNIGTATVMLIIYPSTSVEVTVNGSPLNYATIINDTQANIGVTVGDSQPYTVYHKSGFKTVGQMKIGSKVLGYMDSGSQSYTANNLESGYHTILIRTQDRTEYIYYIYRG